MTLDRIGMNRRQLLRRGMHACVGAAAAPALIIRALARSTAPATLDPNLSHDERRPRGFPAAELRIGIVALSSASGAAAAAAIAACTSGIELGMEEAGRTAKLLGRDVTLAGRADTMERAHKLLAANAISAIMCAANNDETAELALAATRQGVMLLNVLATADALRNDRCARMAFHVCASDAMRAGARRLWKASHPTDGEPETWAPSLDRFGAAQLNERFRARFSRPMDSNAWAGWFAVKVVWEASERARAVDGATITRYLEGDSAQFDGHKGVPLSFRRWDHQLRQPLYIVPSTSGARDSAARSQAAPVAVPATTEGSTRVALDALGTTEEASTCRWS